MLFFFIFLVQKLSGQLHELPNQIFQTADGYGTITNRISCGSLNSQPAIPFQNIIQDDSTRVITIRNYASQTCINLPTIVLDLEPNIAYLLDDSLIDISVTHQLLSSDGNFNFSAILHFEKLGGQASKQIQIMLTSSHFSSPAEAIPTHVYGYFFLDNVFSCSQIVNNSYHTSFQFDDFFVTSHIKWLTNQSIIQFTDNLKSISFIGTFINGSYQTKVQLDLSKWASKKRVQEKIILGISQQIYEFYFQPSPIEFGDFQYLQYFVSPGQYDRPRICFVTNPNTTGQLRPCNGYRIGYYQGSYHIANKFGDDLDYFPLDPALMTLFKITYASSPRYTQIQKHSKALRCLCVLMRSDYDASTNSFIHLSEESYVSKRIEMRLSESSLLKRGTYIEDYTFFFQEYNVDVKFQIFEKPNITMNEPYFYTFYIELQLNSFIIDLMPFINRLYEKGKFQPNQRISQISTCLRIQNGTGHQYFHQIKFPSKSEISYQKTMRCNQLAGCRVCTYTGSCLQCNSADNWLLENGMCRCNLGFIEQIQLNKQICIKAQMQEQVISCMSGIIVDGSCIPTLTSANNQQIQRSLTCLLSDGNITEDECLRAPLSVKAQIALTLTSTPAIGMILKIGQLISLVDDFTFYIYINTTYGKDFRKFLYLTRNISLERWVPFSLSSFYYDIQDYYDQKTKLNNTGFIPQLWTDMDEDSAFIRNTRDFWIASVPLTLIIFVVLHLLFRILKKFSISFCYYFINFKWFTIFFVNIFVQNIQLLTFRAFQQILFFGPPLSNQLRIMYFSNQVMCYFTLFCVVICTCAGQYLIRIFIGLNIKHTMDLVEYNNCTVWFVFFLQLGKMVNGFIFANFQLDNYIKMLTLMSVQGLLLITIVIYRTYFHRKSMFLLLIIEYILKVVINLFLFLRIWLKVNSYQLSEITSQTLGDIEITIIWIVFGVASFEQLTVFIRGSTHKIIQVNSKKIHEVSSSRKQSDLISFPVDEPVKQIQVIENIKKQNPINIDINLGKEIKIKNFDRHSNPAKILMKSPIPCLFQKQLPNQATNNNKLIIQTNPLTCFQN